VGMRERVALYGGSLQTDAHPAGGYAVRVRLPFDAAAG
jgi:signal transduction histidine kinase